VPASRPTSRRPRRRVRAAFVAPVAAVVATLSTVLALLPALTVVAGSCWLPPVVAGVADPFRAPACPWCAGNRGIEYAVGGTTVVRAVAPGVVTFSSLVAGTRYVVVDIGAGRRVTYGRLSSATVRRGDRVLARAPIGTVSATLFFGLRVHGAYTDPSPFLGELVGRPRLIPADGSSPRPAPSPVLRCGSGSRHERP
jgi:murein DD-endopeptidase MepM/ murein hydrolase activator NlpD